MKCGVRVHFYIAGGAALLALAGCGRSFLHYGEERASWRHEAEVTCLKSGTVKLGAGVVQIEPIEGPGMCGAEFPLKVAVTHAKCISLPPMTRINRDLDQSAAW